MTHHGDMLYGALVIMSVLLAVPLAAAGVGKITSQPRLVEELERLGVRDSLRKQLGIVDIVGSAGIVAGLWFPIVGILAALAWMGYWAAAAYWHVRAGDGLERMGGPVLFGFVTVIVLGLQLMVNA